MAFKRETMLRLGAVAVMLAWCQFAPAPAMAERISAQDCKAFEAEREKLEKSDLPKDVEKGPEWAKTNLKPERIKLIGRFIYLQEQLEFRCPEVLADAAVRQMEEQARLRALARVERERLWLENLKKIVPPERKPESKIARAKNVDSGEFPPLPERKAQ